MLTREDTRKSHFHEEIMAAVKKVLTTDIKKPKPEIQQFPILESHVSQELHPDLYNPYCATDIESKLLEEEKIELKNVFDDLCKEGFLEIGIGIDNNPNFQFFRVTEMGKRNLHNQSTPEKHDN